MIDFKTDINKYVALNKKTLVEYGISASELSIKLFSNPNPNSKYVPFYSILYRDHLYVNKIQEIIPEFVASGSNLNIEGLTLGKLLKSILYSGFTKIEKHYNAKLKWLLQTPLNRTSIKSLILEALHAYIYQEPDLSIQLCSKKIYDFNKVNIKSYIQRFKDPPFITGHIYNTNEIFSVHGNYFFSTYDDGILACLMVKREDVPLIRSKFLLTGEWDISLMEFWFKKEYLQYESPGNKDTNLNIEFPKDQICLVSDFDNIFSTNKHKTLSDKRAYLKAEEESLMKLITDGVSEYYKKIEEEKLIAKQEIINLGFEFVE